uniref:RNA-directed DNA polymerase, eukaryota n=1 Tax=Tanacetum cinerariifolium TaxID=118510 RepID=A0A6L2JJA9_TANCI|nr:RNA-directed DNA polymerase, eukaryota [Tanacetum cinerariifolium]
MAYSVPHSDDEIQALVKKLIDGDMVHQKAILDLALQFDNACTAKDDLRKSYEKCNHIPQESRALIDTFLKEGSDKDYELNLSMYRKAEKIEKLMNAKLVWLKEKYNYRSQTHIDGSSSQTHDIGDVFLTEKELHQLHLDEEALRETLEEQAMDEKAREDKIRQKQSDDGALMSTQEYMQKVVEDMGEDDDFKSGKLEQVVAIVKSCSPNVLGDLTVNMKDLSGVAMILANFSIFSPRPSMHYLNITRRNVVKVFRKDIVPGSGSGGRGILCVWDPNMFQKINNTVSDYFFMVRGVWVSSGKRLLIISVHDPQDLSEKKMLWDYLSFVIRNWDGEIVIMGDFHEVCDISERFGSIFNKNGADAFNSFIVNAGLVKVLLGGCSFTWCNKFLSDHRPIIMREAHYDYGPIPFKFFHYWFKLDGFDKKSILKDELADLDGVIDKGEGLDGHRRREVIRLIQEVEKVDAMKVAQKTKIKWSIEGDENSKYYHGVLNKKRGHLSILGVLVDGIWMESSHLVKHEFFEDFKNRFEKPNKSYILLESDFIKRISLEQNDDLEREVSNDEIKRAVWNFGIDKAPGPDGFTFGFYRRYWDIIGNDVVDAVKWINRNKSNIMGISVDSKKVKHAAAKIVPMKVRQNMVSICARFFNGADVNSKKPSWVRRKSVLAAKDVGCLGVSSLFALNRALMFKWVWRFFFQKNSLWVRVVKALHGEDGKIGKKVQPRYSSTWLNIINEIESLKLHGIDLVSFITPKLGNGVNTSFWDVAWCGDIAFKNLVPRLDALESMKKIEVASKLSHEGLEFSFRRNSRGGVE